MPRAPGTKPAGPPAGARAPAPARKATPTSKGKAAPPPRTPPVQPPEPAPAGTRVTIGNGSWIYEGVTFLEGETYDLDECFRHLGWRKAEAIAGFQTRMKELGAMTKKEKTQAEQPESAVPPPEDYDSSGQQETDQDAEEQAQKTAEEAAAKQAEYELKRAEATPEAETPKAEPKPAESGSTGSGSKSGSTPSGGS